MARAGSPKGRRLHARAVARREAASQAVPDSCGVCVVGAGASGLCAASLLRYTAGWSSPNMHGFSTTGDT